MLRLYLLRHAKAAWPAGVEDYDRPLAPRGREAGPLVATYMKQEGFVPDLVLVSTAKRTLETFAFVRGVLGEVKFLLKREIYGASTDDLLEILHDVDASIKSVMIIGHNPGIAELSETLLNVQKSNPAAVNHLSLNYPTAGLAVFDFKLNQWGDVHAGQGNLRQFITPRVLGGVDEH